MEEYLVSGVPGRPCGPDRARTVACHDSSRLRTYASFVRFSHSVFALPFALAGALLAARHRAVRAGRAVVLDRRRAWSRRAARRWDSTGSSTRASTRAIRAPRCASCRAARMTPREAAFFVAVGLGRVRVRGVAARPAVSARCRRWRSAIVFWYSLAKRVHDLHAAVSRPGDGGRAGGRLACGRRPRAAGSRGCSASRSAPGSAGSTCSTPARTSSSIARTACVRSRCDSASPRSLAISRVHARRDRGLRWRRSACVRRLGRSTPPASRSSRVLLVYEQSLVSADDLSQVKRAFDLNGWVGILYLVATAAAVVDCMSRMTSPVRRRSRSASPAPAARSTRCGRSRRCSSAAATLELVVQRLRPPAACATSSATGRDVDRLLRRSGRQRYGERRARRARSSSTATAISARRSPAAATAATAWSIVPCSMKTLAGVAHGLSRNLDRARGRRHAEGAAARWSSCRARRR